MNGNLKTIMKKKKLMKSTSLTLNQQGLRSKLTWSKASYQPGLGLKKLSILSKLSSDHLPLRNRVSYILLRCNSKCVLSADKINTVQKCKVVTVSQPLKYPLEAVGKNTSDIVKTQKG